MASPTYMGFRVKRYGPHVTSFTDDFPGTVVVRALRKRTRLHPAITAPTANRTPPATVLTRAASGRMVAGRIDSRIAPRRYVKTNTHGTGTCIRKRMGFFTPQPLPVKCDSLDYTSRWDSLRVGKTGRVGTGTDLKATRESATANERSQKAGTKLR